MADLVADVIAFFFLFSLVPQVQKLHHIPFKEKRKPDKVSGLLQPHMQTLKHGNNLPVRMNVLSSCG